LPPPLNDKSGTFLPSFVGEGPIPFVLEEGRRRLSLPLQDSFSRF
jgi:hypothetical protein